MREIISLLLLIFSIKCEDWYDEVNGHSKDDSDYGYAGSANNPFTDFYLCSERKYRAHFLDDDNVLGQKNLPHVSQLAMVDTSME